MKRGNRTINTLLVSSLIWNYSAVCAGQLPVVTVTGTYTGGGGFGEYGGGITFGGQPFDGYFELIAGFENYELAKNVRCSATGNNRDVTSQHDVTDRWQAAEQVYRNLKTFDSFWTRWGGPGTLKKNSIITVVYADGGSEEWKVYDPMLTTALGGQPLPNSLKPGNGIVQRHPYCDRA